MIKNLGAAVIGATLISTSQAPAQVLYRYSDGTLFDGRFGPVALAQEKANAALVACGKPASITVDGKFGSETRLALSSLAGCPAFAALARDEDARAGALTVDYWNVLVGAAAPGVDARARTLMLTYEATDYTRMEWNFCQSKPLYEPAAGGGECWSNDPTSYLTWGPNGATAGGGREVQLILQAVDADDPSILDKSFGAEAGAVRRMFQLENRATSRALETYLCGVWADPSRRQAWRAGFTAVGRLPQVRAKFDEHYRSSDLDGGKIRTFFAAYSSVGLVPTEVDYAFFKDRSAHTSPSAPAIRQAISTVLATDRQPGHWKVRRAIAMMVRPRSQTSDRLGRDVAFYVDGAGLQGLSKEEREAWMHRGRLRASDAGLDDARPFATFTPGPAISAPIANQADLTPVERNACPAEVLATRRPRRQP